MKKTVTVTIDKEIDIELPDDLLTPEALQEFSSSIFEITTVNELFEHTAAQLALHGAHFVEGVGMLRLADSQTPLPTFCVTYEAVDAEVLE